MTTPCGHNFIYIGKLGTRLRWYQCSKCQLECYTNPEENLGGWSVVGYGTHGEVKKDYEAYQAWKKQQKRLNKQRNRNSNEDVI